MNIDDVICKFCKNLTIAVNRHFNWQGHLDANEYSMNKQIGYSCLGCTIVVYPFGIHPYNDLFRVDITLDNNIFINNQSQCFDDIANLNFKGLDDNTIEFIIQVIEQMYTKVSNDTAVFIRMLHRS